MVGRTYRILFSVWQRNATNALNFAVTMLKNELQLALLAFFNFFFIVKLQSFFIAPRIKYANSTAGVRFSKYLMTILEILYDVCQS